jgi:hypothetical protein
MNSHVPHAVTCVAAAGECAQRGRLQYDEKTHVLFLCLLLESIVHIRCRCEYNVFFLCDA